jgi:hypothetical protein
MPIIVAIRPNTGRRNRLGNGIVEATRIMRV